jgi:hypothetical protein
MNEPMRRPTCSAFGPVESRGAEKGQHRSGDPDLSARIRKAGRTALWIRWGAALFGAGLSVCLLVPWREIVEGVLAGRMKPSGPAWIFGFAVMPAWVGGFMATLPATAAMALTWRAFCRRRFRRQLASLSSEEQAAILVPLLDGPASDSRTLARQIARELWIPADGSRKPATELAPAPAPTGRGDEVTAGRK